MLKLVTGRDAAILKAPAALVENPLSPEIQELLPQMIAAMRKAKGVGLAAPQIGLPLRLAVAEVEKKIYYWINPKITKASQEKAVFEEGCLSLPGEFMPIVRSERVTLRYLNEKGLPKKLAADGFLAIVIQHELDHLEGILIADRRARQKVKFPE